MEYYTYNVELPFSGTRLWYKDITSKQQLVLSKSNILFPLEDENFLEYSTIAKKVFLNCVENKEDFHNINIMEYVFFLLKLRMTSIGNELVLLFKNPKGSVQENTKVTIDLNNFMKNLYEACLECKFEDDIVFDNIKIKTDWPNLESETILLSSKNDTDDIINSIPNYISNIEIKNKNIKIQKFNQQEKISLYDKLPNKVRSAVETRVLKMIKTIYDKNLFNISKMDYFKFNFYNKNYQHLIRLLFSENLRNIYQEYYVLASRNINPSYVDNLTISERRVYVSFVEEDMKIRKEKAESMNNDNNETTDLADLMDEFGE